MEQVQKISKTVLEHRYPCGRRVPLRTVKGSFKRNSVFQTVSDRITMPVEGCPIRELLKGSEVEKPVNEGRIPPTSIFPNALGSRYPPSREKSYRPYTHCSAWAMMLEELYDFGKSHITFWRPRVGAGESPFLTSSRKGWCSWSVDTEKQRDGDHPRKLQLCLPRLPSSSVCTKRCCPSLITVVKKVDKRPQNNELRISRAVSGQFIFFSKSGVTLTEPKIINRLKIQNLVASSTFPSMSLMSFLHISCLPKKLCTHAVVTALWPPDLTSLPATNETTFRLLASSYSGHQICTESCNVWSFVSGSVRSPWCSRGSATL